jgi:hypothetical protein
MYDYDLFEKNSLNSNSSFASKNKQNSFNSFSKFSSTANTSKNDNLILPYYQSDKWVKLLKLKVSNMASEYNDFLLLQYEKFKKKANLNKNNFNNNNIFSNNINNINFPLIEDKKNNLENNLNNNNNLDNNIFEEHINEPGMKFEEINKLQKCSLQKMFPKFRNKTAMNFYSAKNKNAKIKKISLFVNNNNNFVKINNSNDIEEGIQTNPKTFYNNKENLKKQQYINFINQKSQNNYMKFYYNCYG